VIFHTKYLKNVRASLGNWKTWFFGVKSWFFTRNTPKIFAPPSARRNLFKCAPLTWNPGSVPAKYMYVIKSCNHDISETIRNIDNFQLYLWIIFQQYLLWYCSLVGWLNMSSCDVYISTVSCQCIYIARNTTAFLKYLIICEYFQLRSNTWLWRAIWKNGHRYFEDTKTVGLL
jgi:hypothetical protein